MKPTRLLAGVPVTTPFVAPEELARRGGHRSLLRLGANESAFGTSPRALAAMQRELQRTAWYGDPESIELREALAAKHRCTVENITVASGIDDLLGLAVRGYLEPRRVAVTSLGTYPTFNFHVVGYGGTVEAVPYRSDSRIDLEALARAARTCDAPLVYLANPDNPSGTFWDASAVARFVDALPRSTMLLLDEAYADFAPPADLPEEKIDARVLRLRTFSKAYGMAGARIGYCLASRDVVETFQKIRLHYGVNRSAQIGALASLDDPGFVAGVVAAVAEGRADYYELASLHGVSSIEAFTNFVCHDLGTKARAVAMLDELLRRGVFVRKPGAPPLDRYIRVTVGTPQERAAFAAHFGEALAALDEKTAVFVGEVSH